MTRTSDSRAAAIVGVGAILPDAPSAPAFWDNLQSGRYSIRDVPKERWDPELYYDPESMNGDKTPSKWGGFLPEIIFDPLEYGLPPRSLSAIEPVQLLALQIAKRAIADAGYQDRDFPRERTSVIFGAEAGTVDHAGDPASGIRDFVQPGDEGEVFADIQVGVQGIVLRQVTDATFDLHRKPGDILAAYAGRPGCLRQETGDDLHQG